MKRDEDQRVVDLNRYRRAAAERTRARPKPQAGRPASAGRQPLLGGNRFAGPILAAALLVAAAMAFGPMLLR